MRLGKLLTVIFFCMVLHTVYAGVGRCEIIDRTVATVNGEIILYSEVKAHLLLMEKMIPELKTDDPQKKAQIEREALTQLIRQRLAQDEVKRQKISVSDIELDAAIQDMMKRNNLSQPDLDNILKESGQTNEKFRDGVRKDLERNKLVDRVLRAKTLVTDQQIDAALKDSRPDSVASQKKVRLGIIFLPAGDKKGGGQDAEKTGREILDQLKGGGDFRKLAMQYSKGPAAEDGGDVGFISAEELAPHIAQAVEGLKKDQVSNLVKGETGYYIVKVFDISLQRQNASDTAVREKVRGQLLQKEMDRKFEEWIKKLESKAFIEITL